MGEDIRQAIEQTDAADWKSYNPGSHKDIKKIIQDNINSVCANYVAIGFYLNVVNNRKLYEEDGYSGIGEYAAAEYGIQKDKCSYLMKIADKFCIPNSPALLPEYRNFTVSKLREMIYLTDDQLEQVTITTTRAEIREMRKPEIEKVALAQLEPDCFIRDQINETHEEGLKCSGGISDKCQGCDKVKPEETVLTSEQGPVKEYPSCKFGGGKCNLWLNPLQCSGSVRCKSNFIADVELKVMEQSKTMNAELENVDNEPEIVNDVDENVIETSESVIKEPESVFSSTQGDEDTEQVETVEADIIETLSTVTKSPDTSIPSHLELAKEMLKQKQERLREFINVQTNTYADRKYIESRKVEVGALAAYIFELEGMPEHVRPTQPELPILKNNDQRKDWAENYRAWGEWYYDEHIDCHYYKYDFPNGDRLVVEEYKDRERYWADDKKDEQYYHLLQKEKKAYGGEKTYQQKFSHQTSSMTEIVEFLKDLQKKGV